MASFRFHGTRWQARVRRKGHADETRSFISRQDAERWARSLETAMDRGSFISSTEAQRTTLGDLIGRYIDEVLPGMKGAHDDQIRLKAMQRHSLCNLAMTALTPSKVARYRDERQKQVSAGTVVRELAYLSSVINHGRREWGIHVDNPVALIRKPSAPNGRDRVLSSEEERHLLAQLQPEGRRNVWMLPLVTLALETAMRRGELLALQWNNIDLSLRTATLETSKNSEGRTVPLSTKAAELLKNLPRSINGAVFPIHYSSVAAAFKKAVRRSGLL